MSTFARCFAVLDLFTEDNMVWSVEQINDALGYSTPTTYRYVRDLVSTGLLAPFGDGTYSLGSRIVELDFLIRRADPLLDVGLPVVRGLVARTGYDIQLIALCGNRIVTIHQEAGSEPLPLSFGRGRAMPPLRGAGARIISAYLPNRILKQVYEANRDDAEKLNLGGDWKSFSRAMAGIRQEGFAISHGELDPGFFGLAAPVFGPDSSVIASVVAALSHERQELAQRDKLAALITKGAAHLTEALADLKRVELEEHDRGDVRTPQSRRDGTAHLFPGGEPGYGPGFRPTLVQSWAKASDRS